MLETRVVQVEGTPVRLAVAGRGDPVVLIHGLAGSWNWWRRNISALSEHRTVYLVDLPGFGAMRTCGPGFSLAEAPAWMRAVLKTLRLARPSIVAHSMGGAIALALAATWPDEVDRLVLAAPAVGLPRKTVLSNVGPFLGAMRHVHPAFYSTLLWDAIRAGPTTVLRAANSLVTMETVADLAQVRSPALLIWGQRDNLVPLTVGQTLAALLPSARLQVLEGAGHVVMFDRPAAFNQTVLDFLSGEVAGT
ncbi:MAG TPA: alpha/beta fold hydrolase [Bryobacteraceae bacterium]|nr:alpha/beta fold hydrolase [Bryobacteraceae bacterium]